MVEKTRSFSQLLAVTKLLEPILASPELPRYVQQLNEVLAREHTLRQKFYEEITEQQKAEFINGQVVLHSPVQRKHSLVSDFLFKLLSAYVDQNDLGWVGHEKLLVALTRNDYEPDLAFWKADRTAGFSPDQMKFPAPDFVAEVLSASRSRSKRCFTGRPTCAPCVGCVRETGCLGCGFQVS